MTQQTEVKAKLTLDSNAEAVLGKLQAEVTTLRDDVRAAQDGFSQFGATLGALMVNDAIKPALASVKQLASDSIGLANAAMDVRQGMAGMMAGMSGKEWNEAIGASQHVQEKITGIAIAVGQSKESIEANHRALRTFLGGTDEAFDIATRNMENLTVISNVTGVRLDELGMQFGKMSAGFVSMESPVFNLLKTTGIFSSELSKVNQEWQKLTAEERVARLEGAVSKVAGNLATAAPTVNDMLTSMKETGHAFMESFGGAFLREVIDELQQLRTTINQGGKEFDKLAESLGKDFGKEVANLINDLIEAAQYFRENGHEIAEDIRDAFRFARDTIKFLVDNAGLIAAIAAGSKIVGAMPSGTIGGFAKGMMTGAQAESLEAQVAKSLASGSFKAASGGVGEGLAGRAGAAIPGLISAIVAGGPPVWAAAGAVTALGAAAAYVATQAAKEDKQKRDRIEDLMRRERERYAELHELQSEEREQRKRDMQELIALARELGDEAATLRRFKNQGADARNTLDQHVTPFTVSAANYEQMLREPLTNAQLLAETEMKAVDEVTRGLREAVKTGDAEVSGAILKALYNSEKLKEAFMKSADIISIGSDGIRQAMDAIEQMGLKGGYLYNKFADVAKTMAAPSGPQVNFNGGQTFKIQQDFRDQDPDRIAIAFERRITRSAVSRVRASTGD